MIALNNLMEFTKYVTISRDTSNKTYKKLLGHVMGKKNLLLIKAHDTKNACYSTKRNLAQTPCSLIEF